MMKAILSPLQQIIASFFSDQKIRFFVKRDDLIDSPFPGNKHRKLVPHLQLASQLNKKHLITCGGAFSNHLQALTSVPDEYNFKITAFVRGEIDKANPNIQQLVDHHISLIQVARKDYGNIDQLMEAHVHKLAEEAYVIPEGGTSQLAVNACGDCYMEIELQLGHPPDYIVCPVGSGGTIAGIISKAPKSVKVIGVVATRSQKSVEQVRQKIDVLVPDAICSWSIENVPSLGHFGHLNEPLSDAVKYFKKDWDVLVDPIYTVRSFQWIYEAIEKGAMESRSISVSMSTGEGVSIGEGASIVGIHTGGLQGWEGMKYRFGDKFELDFYDKF